MMKSLEKNIEHAKKLYNTGKITLAKAAEIAGVSRWDMIEAYEGTWQYKKEDLEEDLKPL